MSLSNYGVLKGRPSGPSGKTINPVRTIRSTFSPTLGITASQ